MSDTMRNEESGVRAEPYAIYKANRRGNGGVVRFELNAAKGAVFVDAANQSGERQFDWERKITMKWGLADLGSVLAVLDGRKEKAKLFHQAAKANSACELTARAEEGRAPFVMTVSRQEAEDKSVRKVMIPVSRDEAEVLETILRRAVVRILGW